MKTKNEIILQYFREEETYWIKNNLDAIFLDATIQAINYGYKAGLYAKNSSPRLINETINEYLNEIDK